MVVRGASVESAVGEPYQPLVEGLETTLAGLSDGRLRSVIGRSATIWALLMPTVGERLDDMGIDRSPPRLVAPDQLGSRVLESLMGLIERLAATGVVLLILEDLHWADPATRAFVGAMLRVRRQLPLCLVLTYRPEDLLAATPLATDRRRPHRRRRDRAHRPATVGPDALERLVTSLQGARPAGDVMAAIQFGSGGNPMVVRHILAANRSVDGVRLSDSFEDGVGAMLDALSPAARAVVRLLAAARQSLPRSTVAGARPGGLRITTAAISNAIASDLVTETGDRLAIGHELHAEVIESLELPSERVELHALLALMLAASPSRAAWHLEAAGRTGDALAAHRRAADLSGMTDPGETTLFHRVRIMELSAADLPGADALRDGDDATDLLLAARAAAACGAFRRAAGFLRRAIAATGRARQGERHDLRRVSTGGLHEELGRMLWASGDLAGGIAAMEHALATLPPGPSQARARALATLAQHLMLDGRFVESTALAEQARDVADAVGPVARPELAHALCTLGVDRAWQGSLDQGLGLLKASAAVARREGRLDDLMRAALNRTTLLDLDARREQALEVVTVGIRDADSGGLGRTYGSLLRGNAADILYQLGRWAESEAECRVGMEWQPTSVAWFAPRSTWGSCSWSRAPTTKPRTWWDKRCSSWTRCPPVSGPPWCSGPPSVSPCGMARSPMP